MKNSMISLQSVSLLHYPSRCNNNQAIIISPSSAGYYAEKKEAWGDAKSHIDFFCDRLAEKYHVFYLILPGQDPMKQDTYSYDSSVNAITEAMFHIVCLQHKGECLKLKGAMGMCTGGALLADSFMSHVKFSQIPLVLYSSAAWVGWSVPKLQDRFTSKYPHVRLDRESLLSAPMPGDVIKNYKGPILQILVSSIDYPLGGRPGRGGQEELQGLNESMHTVLFKEMSDVPVETSLEYQPMMRTIFEFFD